jgi:hypothetical protein
MSTCARSTLYLGVGNQGSCRPACADIGPADCIDSNKLSPRRSRGIVIQQLKDYCQLMLGAPVITLELDEQQLDLAVKNTLKIMEYYAPQEYFRYYTFPATPGKSIYAMPPDVGYIRQVSYREMAEYSFQAADLGGSIPIEYFAPGGGGLAPGMIDPIQPIWSRAGEWAVYKGYERMFSRMSSGIGGWEFVSGYRHIKLYPIPHRAFSVVVHYMQRCNDWDEVTMCMQEGALAHAKMMCARIRSKYASLPGPGGGLQLDGDKLLQEGLDEYKQWKEDLIYRYGGPLSITFD